MPRFTNFRPAGVIPATLLALNDDMSINERQTRKHLRDCALIDGVSAVTVNGHSSEVHACTFAEQQQILAASLAEVGNERSAGVARPARQSRRASAVGED